MELKKRAVSDILACLYFISGGAVVLKLPMVVVEWTTTVPVCVISSALSCNWILDHRRRKEPLHTSLVGREAASPLIVCR